MINIFLIIQHDKSRDTINILNENTINILNEKAINIL